MTTVFLTGLDGTGKSTLANALMQPTGDASLHEPVRVHQYDALLPLSRWAKAFIRRKGLKAKLDPAFKPESDKPESDTSSTAKGAVTLVSAGWLVSGFGRAWVRCLFARMSTRDLISDRCFVDEVLRREWSLGGESAFARRLLALSPRPSLLIVLTPADLAVSWNRKKAFEYSIEAYQQKHAHLTSILRAPSLRGWNTLHIEVDEAMTADQVLSTVRDRLKADA